MESLDGVIFHFFLEDKKSVEAAVRQYMRWEENGYRPAKGKEPDAYWKFGIE